jgi:hypothetical protein
MSNLRFSEDLQALLCSVPVEFPQHLYLREKTLKYIQSIFESVFEHISSVSLAQYRGVSFLVDALNQFRLSTPGEAYQALDLIIDEMKEFGEKMLVSKEESLEVAFSFIASCWKSDGTITRTPLPNELFSEHLTLFIRILSDFHEFL